MMRDARIEDVGGNASKIPFPPPAPTVVADPPKATNVESWKSDPNVQLMERARDGDMSAFQELFRKHASHVVKFAYQFVHSHERAEDIAQMVFIQLYRARERYEPRARFLTFLYRITTNLCLNELRRREYSVRIDSLDAAPEDQDEDLRHIADGVSPDPAEYVATAELASGIQAALEKLPVQQRAAFLLGRIEGLSYADVAESLDVSVSAVKSLIFRATGTMRRDLRAFL